MTRTDPNLLKKIKGLLTLAAPDRGGTEEERDTAMKMATDLMAKYNIAEWEVATEDEKRKGVTHRRYTTKGKTKKWEGMLYHYIGSGIGVKAVYSQSPFNKWEWNWTLIGREADLDFLEILYESLVPWLKIQAKLGRATHQPSNPNAFNRAFFDNAGHIVNVRLKHQRESAYKSSTGTELVLATDSMNERYAQEMFGRLRSSKARGFGNVAGEISGREAGAKADLSAGRKVEGKSTQRHLGR